MPVSIRLIGGAPKPCFPPASHRSAVMLASVGHRAERIKLALAAMLETIHHP